MWPFEKLTTKNFKTTVAQVEAINASMESAVAEVLKPKTPTQHLQDRLLAVSSAYAENIKELKDVLARNEALLADNIKAQGAAHAALNALGYVEPEPVLTASDLVVEPVVSA